MISVDPKEYDEFVAWRKAHNKSELDLAFDALEKTLTNPGGRQFNCIMPSLAYRTLANAIIALKKQVVPHGNDK